jgi:hypothetical protein
MSGDDRVGRGGEGVHGAIALQHLDHIGHDRKGPVLLEIGIEVRGIRGQHHPAAPRHHPGDLQAAGMPADPVHGDAGRHLALAVMEPGAAGEDPPHHLDHILGLEGAAQVGVAHAASGAERHLPVLQVIMRIRKHVVVSAMVVVHVGDDDVLDLLGLDADRLQPHGGGAQVLALALGAHLRGEAGVEDEAAILALDRPDEIVERHRHVVLVAADEILRRMAEEMRVFDGVDFIDRQLGHAVSP